MFTKLGGHLASQWDKLRSNYKYLCNFETDQVLAQWDESVSTEDGHFAFVSSQAVVLLVLKQPCSINSSLFIPLSSLLKCLNWRATETIR